MLIPNGHGRAAARQHRVLRPGLSLLLGNERQCEASVGQAVVDDYLRIVLVLEGAIDVFYGSSRVQLAANGRPSLALDAAMVTMLEPEEMRRVVRQGESSRRIGIGLNRQWLQESLGDAQGLRVPRHLETLSWHASPRARLIAEQIINPPPLPEALVSMYLESRVIELIIEALASTSLSPDQIESIHTPPLRTTARQRMQDLKVWLSDHASSPVTIEQIARQLNTTPSTLQRHFRAAHGLTIFDYLQQERLKQARRALERDGISISDAAAQAGYGSQSSFATAFRRYFGITPKQVRPSI
jgi:AraC-like DNA-binding protein